MQKTQEYMKVKAQQRDKTALKTEKCQRHKKLKKLKIQKHEK